MSKHHRELPGGGTLTYEVETDDEAMREVLEEHIEIGIQAVRNVEEARS